MKKWEPAVGDDCMELRMLGNRLDRVGQRVHVKTVTETLIITSDGERYNRQRLHPVSEGRFSARVLVPTWDKRALAASAVAEVRTIAVLADNLAHVGRSDPEEILADLATIAREATDARTELIRVMRGEKEGR